MKKHQIAFFLTACILFIASLTGGCNLPGSELPTEVSSDLVYTMAAGTVVTHLTQEASESLLEEETPADTPTINLLEGTQTPEPTNTQEPTATPSPTETPTRTKIPDTILEDDFSNPSLWYVAEEDHYFFEYEDGVYRVFNELLNGAIWSIKYQEYEDIRIEVDATRQAGPDESYYGVICRFDNEGDDYYALVINDSGFNGILKMLDGEMEFLATGWDESGIIKKGLGGTNRIQGVCLGERLILYANDQQLLEVMDDSLKDGIVGMVAGNRLSGVGIDVAFDNFALVWP